MMQQADNDDDFINQLMKSYHVTDHVMLIKALALQVRSLQEELMKKEKPGLFDYGFGSHNVPK